jgi:TonB family protein
MKKTLFFIAILCVSSFAKAQDTTKQAQSSLFTFVDKKPEFPGGEKAFISYLIEHIKYPENVQKERVIGKMYSTFVVSKNGSISQVKILYSGLSPYLDAEVMRLLTNMPNWTPAIKDTETVAVTTTQVIQFPLDGVAIISKNMNSKAETENVKAPKPIPIQDNEDRIYTFAEQKPEFPGGEKALTAYLKKNVNMPEMAKKNGEQGKVFITFVVEKDGSLSNPKVLRGIGNGCDDEAVRVVKNMPKWLPGKQNGQTIRVQYTLPIIFK